MVLFFVMGYFVQFWLEKIAATETLSKRFETGWSFCPERDAS